MLHALLGYFRNLAVAFLRRQYAYRSQFQIVVNHDLPCSTDCFCRYIFPSEHLTQKGLHLIIELAV